MCKYINAYVLWHGGGSHISNFSRCLLKGRVWKRNTKSLKSPGIALSLTSTSSGVAPERLLQEQVSLKKHFRLVKLCMKLILTHVAQNITYLAHHIQQLYFQIKL